MRHRKTPSSHKRWQLAGTHVCNRTTFTAFLWLFACVISRSRKDFTRTFYTNCTYNPHKKRCIFSEGSNLTMIRLSVHETDMLRRTNKHTHTQQQRSLSDILCMSADMCDFFAHGKRICWKRILILLCACTIIHSCPSMSSFRNNLRLIHRVCSLRTPARMPQSLPHQRHIAAARLAHTGGNDNDDDDDFQVNRIRTVRRGQL